MSATLTFRNSRGELVDVPEIAATRLKNEFGAVAAISGTSTNSPRLLRKVSVADMGRLQE